MRPALQPRHRRQRHDADDHRPRASTRSANARRTAASPTAWSRRCSSRPRSAPTTSAQFGIGRYLGSQTSTKLKVTGIDLFSAGDFMGGDGTEEIVLERSRSAASTRSSSIKDDKLVGACLYGDTVDGAWYFKLLRDGRSIADIRDQLMFGESNLGDTGHEGNSRAAAMADDAEVCGCNGVSKGTIVQGDQGQGPVHARRGPQAHQGERVVRLVHRPGRADPDGDRRRRLLRGAEEEGGVRLHRRQPPGGARRDPRAAPADASPSVYERLDWRTPNGCASCRPAINYYLISTWPKEAQDDPQIALHQRARHANIQKDGTYSVDAAHVGRRDQRRRAAPHRRRRRQVHRSRPSRSPAASASTCSA